MQTADQQTAAQIRAQLSQMQNELSDIARNMPTITSTTNLLGAQAEQRDHEAVIRILEQRLEDAETKEAAAAERARRQANETIQADAAAKCADLTEQLKNRQVALVHYLTEEQDEMDALRSEAAKLRNTHHTAWQLNNPNRTDYPQLPGFALDLTEQEQHADDALRVLVASRQGYGGTYKELTLASMAQGYQRLMAGGFNAPQRQDLYQPNTALDVEMGYAVSRMNNRDD